MKVTEDVVREFEAEQKEFGTRVALVNVIRQLAFELMEDTGVVGMELREVRRAESKREDCAVCGTKHESVIVCRRA